MRTIVAHTKAIQSLAFVDDSNFLISLTVQEEGAIRVWDFENGNCIGGYEVDGCANQVVADQIVGGKIQFCSVGNKGTLSIYAIDLENNMELL